MQRPNWSFVLILGVFIAWSTAPKSTFAQELPDEFQNLKILDPDISKDALKEIMTGFTEQLGVKCTHCHVLGEYHKDDNKHKDAARKMINLVQYMRENAATYFKKDVEPNQIACWTCHRGEAEVEGYFPEEEDEDWP